MAKFEGVMSYICKKLLCFCPITFLALSCINMDKKILAIIETLDWGMVLTIVAILVAILIGYSQIKASKKIVKFFILSRSPLVSFDKDYKHDLQIIYKGREIKQALSTVIRIRNSGSQPIKVEDYYRSISFVFQEKTELLNSSIVSTKPGNLRAELSTIENQVILENLLLNPKDYIDISFITSDYKLPEIDARIAGVSDLKLEDNIDYKTFYDLLILLLPHPFDRVISILKSKL